MLATTFKTGCNHPQKIGSTPNLNQLGPKTRFPPIGAFGWFPFYFHVPGFNTQHSVLLNYRSLLWIIINPQKNGSRFGVSWCLWGSLENTVSCVEKVDMFRNSWVKVQKSLFFSLSTFWRHDWQIDCLTVLFLLRIFFFGVRGGNALKK